MKESNAAIFIALDEFCAKRDVHISNAGAARWISTEAAERRFLKESIKTDALAFTASRRMARFDFDSKCYFCTVGFDHIVDPVEFEDVDLDGGFLTTVLSELMPRPRAKAIEISNVVSALDSSLGRLYGGHDFEEIAKFYPTIKIYATESLPPEETLRIFFLICLAECVDGDSWIDEPLADQLRALCQLDRLNIPYKTLCRSIFDADPAALFLALYRCLEALYAYSSAQKLIGALNLNAKWPDVATALEDQLDWHPREETSLIDLLAHAVDHDLYAIFEALGAPINKEIEHNLSAIAGRRIYQLRNGLVHYRPLHHKISHSDIDWNRLCEAMTGLVFHIYAKVFDVT